MGRELHIASAVARGATVKTNYHDDFGGRKPLASGAPVALQLGQNLPRRLPTLVPQVLLMAALRPHAKRHHPARIAEIVGVSVDTVQAGKKVQNC